MAIRTVVLNRYIKKCEVPTAEIFSIEDSCEEFELQEGQVLVKTLFLSVDPYMRYKMMSDTSTFYLEPWKVAHPCHGGGVGQVVQSAANGFTVGDFVESFFWPWKTTCKVEGKLLNKIEHEVIKSHPSLALGCLGITGLTAYLGLKKHANILQGQNQCVVISGAAGACGTIAGQLAKVMGSGSVVGICGSDTKCRYLIEELQFDAALNYKTNDIPAALKKSCPNGVDVYFDNVGGEISDEVIKQMNKNSSIVLCGQISMYNKDIQYPPPLQTTIDDICKARNISRERFLVLNYQDEWKETLDILANLYKEHKLKSKETITEGIENVGHAFISVMTGGNIGKQVVKVS